LDKLLHRHGKLFPEHITIKGSFGSLTPLFFEVDSAVRLARVVELFLEMGGVKVEFLKQGD
jgi:hypothetical protein